MKNVWLVLVLGAALIGGAVAWRAYRNPHTPVTPVDKPVAYKDSRNTSLPEPGELRREAGADSTGDAKAAPDNSKAQPESTRQATVNTNPNDYGRVQPVRTDVNAQVASVAEALKSKRNPERLSPLIPPKPFDPEAYKKDSAPYLSVVEPGRCYQAKDPGKNVPRIQAACPQLQQVAQGQSVVLRAKALAGWPVTFSSFDLGKFSNELTSITVEADAAGIAEARFFGAPGTINEVNILCSSPMTSGQLKFLVHVTK